MDIKQAVIALGAIAAVAIDQRTKIKELTDHSNAMAGQIGELSAKVADLTSRIATLESASASTELPAEFADALNAALSAAGLPATAPVPTPAPVGGDLPAIV